MSIGLALLDRFSIATGSAGVPLRLRPRAQRLVACLVLQRERSLPREQLAFSLWPDEPERESLAILRRALNDLRSALGPAGADELVVAAGGELRWNADGSCRVDVVEFERLLAEGTATRLHQAVDLYAGDLLPGWDDEWVVVERERLRGLQLRTLGQLVAHHRALGEVTTALGLARRALALDPLDERVQRDLMTLHFQRGDRAGALAAYERLRSLLEEELGVEPMPETDALRAAIAAGALLPEPAPLAARARKTGAPALLVGREPELEQLAAEWQAAVAGRGRLAIVSGEAGIGKTSLALALAERVAGQGGVVLTGHCDALEQALPYQPLTEMLRAAAGLLRHADLEPAHRAALARLAPDVLGIAGPLPEDGGALDPKAQLFDSLLEAFRALARGRPLLLFIDDLHRAAESTIEWLAYAAPRLGAQRLLVVATYRTDEVEAGHALNRLRRRLEREGVVSAVMLQPLTETATRELVAALAHPAGDLAEPLSGRLYRKTAGNPFYLHELILGLLESGRIDDAGHWEESFDDELPAGLALPDSLRETIAGRVERLSETARAFLVAAAVTGRAFRYETVREAGGWEDERALEALDELLARNFVHEEAGGFSFAHDLVRDAVYAGLSAPRRVFWHRRVAGALARAAERLDPDQQQALAARIAYHAGAGEQDALVFRWAPLGAEQAQRLYAHDDALRLLEAASAAFERLRHEPGFDLAEGERRQIDILLRRSTLMPHVGRLPAEHGRVLEMAAELLARHPDERRQATYELRRSDFLADQSRYDEAAEAAIQAAEHCLALDDSLGAAQGLYQAGTSWLTVSRNRAALEAFERAIELYRLAGDASGEVLCRCGMAWGNLNSGRVEVALGHLEPALELCERQGDTFGMARVCYLLAAAWSYYCHAERVLVFAERSVRLYQEMGLAWTAWRPRLFVAAAYFYSGRLELARAELAQITEQARAIQDRWLEGWAAHNLGRLALWRGDLEEAERLLEANLRLRQESGELQNEVCDLAWLGRLRLAQGRPGEALDYTERAVTMLDALRAEAYSWETPDILYAHAEALTAAGDRDAAAHQLEVAGAALLDFAAQIGDPAVREICLSSSIYAPITAAR